MKRHKMKKSVDKKVFKRTAMTTKKMNLFLGAVPRGGTRL